MAVIVLCRLLEGYANINAETAGTSGGESTAGNEQRGAPPRQRRLRALARHDAANFLLRAIATRLANEQPSPLAIMTLEILITTTMRVCARDTKLLLKMRLLGM